MRLVRSIIFLAAFVGSSVRGASESAWAPGKTFVLVASIIQWQPKAGLAPFTDETRLDGDLVAQFQKAGVPAGNITFLKDSQATHAGIRNALAKLAARAGDGSTLIFYFQGHGGRKALCCYDYDQKNPEQTAFHTDEILPILDPVWHGDRLFLMGDCCSSGSLASVVREFERKRPAVRAACIASATASNVSTERWTFTESLIRILAGDPIVDRNRDGKITLSEADEFIHDQMKYRENQLAGITLTPSFEKEFVIRAVAPGKPLRQIPGPWQIGSVMDARDSQGAWYPSEILNWRSTDGAYRVHFYGWESKWDEWVDAGRLRAIVKPKLNINQQYEVQWEDKHWYLATLTKSIEDFFYFAHYESEAGEDDEWITPERTRKPGAATAKDKPEFLAATPRPIAMGDFVAAQWHHEWYRAQVTKQINGTYAVLYDDQTKGRLAADDLIPIARPNEIRPGDRVLACWDRKPRMYPGKVEAVKQELATIRWEDGTAPTEVPVNQVARVRP